MNKRQLLAATAALTLVVGTALAQSATVETKRQTTVEGTLGSPPVTSHSSTQSETTVDAFGNRAESKQSRSVGSGGASSSEETKVKRSDGSSEQTYREQRSNPPSGSSSTSTTTTINR